MAKTQAALSGVLKLAGTLLVITGILHCLGWVVSGWNADTRLLLLVGAAYIVLGLLLHIRQYWTRYISFLVVLIGAVATYILLGSVQISDWQMWGYLVIDLLIIVCLFASIWKGRVLLPA